MKKEVSFWRSTLIGALLLLASGQLAAQQYWYDIVTTSSVYSFNYNQVPDGLVALNRISETFHFQWLSCSTPSGTFTPLPDGTAASYSFTAPLTQTIYVERVTMDNIFNTTIGVSNVVKLTLVSVNWENYNYVREHDVLVPGQNNWEAIDQLTIGQKLQVTTYSDGVGRAVEKISKQTATPNVSQGGTLWGDVVKFYSYDAYGREGWKFLPYTATNAASTGLYKATAVADQAQYCNTVYNETHPYTNIAFDNSPLRRVVNVKDPGTKWGTGNGTSTLYDLNTQADNVQMFEVGDNATDIPVDIGVYPANSLFRTVSTDEKGNMVIIYTDNENRIVLKKVQIDDIPSAAHSGWACTYNIYDDFGLLRYTIQPEGVNYLDNNSWSFSGTNGQLVLTGMSFRYQYDDRGRTTVKQAPGVKEIDMLYDARDRLVFSQDGNQRDKSPGEWLANFYDDLDRVVETALYETSETSASLQTDINTAMGTNAVAQTGPNPAYPSDLVDSSRNTGITTYIADNTITFATGFTSTDNDEFQTQITSQLPTGVSEPVTLYNSPVSATAMADPTQFTALRYNYYDDYTYAGSKPFDNGFNNTLAYSPSDPAVMPIVADFRTTHQLTGTKVRVLGTNTFLVTSYYYEEKGRIIQTLEDNILSGVDITTNQYHFDERLLSIDERHTAAGTLFTNFDIITKNVFDQITRLVSIQKKIGTNDFKTVTQYDLDDMGRLLTKHLDPGYTKTIGTDLEALTYTYNIQNEITGINKDYALKTAGAYSKWGHFYGQYYGYDNKDGLFTDFQLDGHITGTIWSTQGDDVQREYNYSYDHARRLSNALYGEKQNPGDSWSNSQMDFSVSGSGGSIQYDRNGNLLAMLQKGIVPGNQTPVNIDDLQYSYGTLSNQLQSVMDNSNAGTANGHLGDFVKGNKSSNPDYVFDDNGNLIVDLNKGATGLNGETNGISYNYLDKPEHIQITGKGTIQIVYDADGNKLQKIFTAQGSTTPVTTSYINDYVYVGDSLQYINFEEGRIRVMHTVVTPSNDPYDVLNIDGNIDLPGRLRGAYDFFVRDIQQNVRMILTEETHQGSNTCTMEMDRAPNEEPLFGQVDNTGTPTAANEVAARFLVNEIPGQSSGGGWQNSTIGNYVIQLGNLVGKNVGPNTLMRVMAGDAVSAQVIYYYPDPVVNNSGGAGLVTNVLTSLASALGGSSVVPELLRGSAAGAISPLNGSAPFSALVNPDIGNSGGNTPKAYLTVLFFDERFNFIQEGSIAARVQQSGNGAPALVLPNIQAPKNGYAYVYVSNESDEAVYFDNLQVANNHGAILEEDHYYAYGLKIAGISSRVLPDPNEGFVKNKNLYNDQEIVSEADLNWYDYGYRNYDPQIGRFVQQDPLTDDNRSFTPYSYADDEPIGNVDEDGLDALSTAAEGGGDAAKAAAKTTEAVFHDGVASVLQSTTVIGVRKAAATTGWSIAGSFLKGIGQSLLGTVEAVGNSVLHPVTTVVAIAKAVANPIRTFNAIKTAVKETYVAFKNGDANTRANILGKITGEVGQLLVGGAVADVAKGVEEVAEGAKIVEEGDEVVAEVSKVDRAAAETHLPCGCFLPGTLVLTDTGYKRIEQIRPGDIVMAYNDTTHAYGKKKVIRIFEHVRDTVYQLRIGVDVINTTSDHPFFVGGRWLRVKNLRAGDSVLTYSGAKLVIASIRQVVRRTTVHNFEVADYHTYYVSGEKVLVHNNGPCDVKTPHSNATSGETDAANVGRQKHAELAEKVKAKGNGWKSEPPKRGADGKLYKPDIETPSGNLIEYKPYTGRGISRGRTAAKKYSSQLGQKTRVVYYHP